MWNARNIHHRHGRGRCWSTIKRSSGRRQKYVSTLTPFFVSDRWKILQEQYKDGLSDSWTGFTRFTSLNETPRKGCMWSGGRLNKIQTTSRPDHIWLDAWTRIGKAVQRRGKTRMGNRETETRTRQRFERNLFYWPEWRRIQRHH